MGVYANRTCVYCSIKRPAYNMKQVTVEEISGRSGASVSFSPFAGKGKLGKSIRVHSGRTYRSNRKIWVCRREEACHKPNYFIELEKAQKKEREYIAYSNFLRERTLKYISENKLLEKFDVASNIVNKFEELKKTLKPIVDKWISYKDSNKTPEKIKNIGKEDYKILDLSFEQFFKMFEKELSIDKITLKTKYSKKSLKDELFNISPFIQDPGGILLWPILATLFAFFFPNIMLGFGAPESILTIKFGTFHLSFIFGLFILGILAARHEYKLAKPIQTEFIGDRVDVKKIENDFSYIVVELAKEYDEHYRNCVLYYLNNTISLSEYSILPDEKEKKEHRTRFTYYLIPELSNNFDKLTKSFVKFCENIKKPTSQKTTKSKQENSPQTRASEQNTKSSSNIKLKNWTKDDYIRVYNEELFDEIVTLILCHQLAKADGSRTDAENKFISDLPKVDEVIKIMMSKKYPKGKFKVELFCQLLKKKLDEDELINLINNLFFLAEADGEISSAELQFIESCADFMGIDKDKFKMIKENKLEEHIENKKASMVSDDPIIDADFSDMDFD